MSQSALNILSRKWLSCGSLLVGVGICVVGIQASASATETIILTYDADRVDVTVPEMEHFATTGELSPPLQAFFDTTEKVPTQWSSILNDQVRIPSFIESFLHSTRGRYVLHQFDQFIHDSGSQTLINIDDAIAEAMNDGSISLLEIIRDYPEDSVTINLNEVETIYTEVSTLIQEVEQGHWEVAAQDFLQNVLCHCQSYHNSEEGFASENLTSESHVSLATGTVSCSDSAAAALHSEEVMTQL